MEFTVDEKLDALRGAFIGLAGAVAARETFDDWQQARLDIASRIGSEANRLKDESGARIALNRIARDVESMPIREAGSPTW